MKRIADTFDELEGMKFAGNEHLVFEGCKGQEIHYTLRPSKDFLLIVTCPTMRTPHPRMRKFIVVDGKYKMISLNSKDMKQLVQARLEL